MDCAKCNAKCCQDTQCVFLFPPELHLMEAMGYPTTRYGSMGYLETKGRPCPALDQELNRCRVYENRPMTCRTFPLVLNIIERDMGVYYAIDTSACPQHNPLGVFSGKDGLDGLARWYGFSRNLFLLNLCRERLKRAWYEVEEAALAADTRFSLLQRKAREYDLAMEKGVVITRPVLPSELIKWCEGVVAQVFNAFKEAHPTGVWTTTILCDWCEPRIARLVETL